MTSNMLTEYEKYLRNEERSKATIEKYQRDLNALFLFLPMEKEVTKEAIIAYKECLLKKYAVTSVNSVLAGINGFLSFKGWAECRVRLVKSQRKAFSSQERELTKQEYMRLLIAAGNNENQRLRLLMETICSTGIRVSELCFISVEAVKCGRVEVRSKGKSRTVFLPRMLCCKLERYLKQKKIYEGAVFVTKNGKPMDRSNIWHEMKALCKQADVSYSKVFPHNLRHLFARTYYSVEKDLGRLADLLGHSSVETTRIYTMVTGEEQEKQIALLGLVI